ncbi:DedA family protein [Aurantimonas sp. A2-1-M11]|uniref:DedA family protein n=1 Tax=Aurantimonas sp. A2-1-M11 TaxID=3113712 RepID=UPI002F92D449
MNGYLSQYGYGFLFVVVLFESTGIPLPGESILVASGMLAGEGTLNIWLVLLAAFSGSIVGDNLGYLVGRRYGRKIVVRWGSHFGLGEKRFAMVEDRFKNYGFAVVLVARFVIILRQLNGFVAGTMRMSWPIFLFYNVISAALWTAAYGAGAYLFGSAFRHVFEGYSTWPLYVVAGLICLVGVIGTYKFLFAEDSEPDADDAAGDPPVRSES